MEFSDIKHLLVGWVGIIAKNVIFGNTFLQLLFCQLMKGVTFFSSLKHLLFLLLEQSLGETTLTVWWKYLCPDT